MFSVSHILRCTLREASFRSLSPVLLGKCPVSLLGVTSRCQSSATDRGTVQASREQTPSPADLSQASLLEMGFTDLQAQQVQSVCTAARGGKHTLSALTALFVLDLNPSTVLKMLEKCPQLCNMKEAQLQHRIGNLRKLGLIEGSLQRVVVHYPQILTVSVKTIKQTVLFLREKCLFTVQQVRDILRDSPAVVQEDQDQLEYLFQYIYFRMGIKQAGMVKSRLFRFSLDEVRYRHCFLERRGQYQTPDKKGQTTIVNPKLQSILHVNQDTFLSDVAKATAEEFDVFQRLISREWKEERLQYGNVEAESDDDEGEEEEEDEDDEQLGGKSGYMKKRKK